MKFKLYSLIAGVLCSTLFSLNIKAQTGGYMGFAGLSFSHSKFDQLTDYQPYAENKGTGSSVGVHFLDLSCRLGPKIADRFFPAIYIGTAFAGNFGSFHYTAQDPWAGNQVDEQKSSVAGFIVRLNFGLQFSYKVNETGYVGVRYYYGQNVNDIRTRNYNDDDQMFWGIFGRFGSIGYEGGYSKALTGPSRYQGMYSFTYGRLAYILDVNDPKKVLNSVYLRVETSKLTNDPDILYGHQGSWSKFSNIEVGVNHFFL